MEEMTSLWSYLKGGDEMRDKLLCMTLEFEQLKNETNEELIKKNEYVSQLIRLLKVVSQERDEARNQLQKLLNNVLHSSTNPYEFASSLPMMQYEGPGLVKTAKASNSGITECNDYNSHGSSPVDSFFGSVSSPDVSNINLTDSNSNVGYLNHQPMLVQDSDLNVSREMPKVDHATLIMDNLVKGKPLPQKGKFLQAVLDVHPLLHTLLLAGPLPKWRNPPRLQTFQIPPFSMQDPEVVQQGPVNNLSYGGSSKSQNYVQMNGSSQMPTTQTFNSTPSGSCLGANNLESPGANSFFSLAKRQRLQ